MPHKGVPFYAGWTHVDIIANIVAALPVTRQVTRRGGYRPSGWFAGYTREVTLRLPASSRQGPGHRSEARRFVRSGFDADLVVDGVTQFLPAPEILLCRLDGNVS